MMPFPITHPPLACQVQQQQQQEPRQEIDLFQELITLATDNTTSFHRQQQQQQHIWQYQPQTNNRIVTNYNR